MKFRAKVDWWLHIIFAGYVIANIWAIVSAVMGGAGSIIIVAVLTPISIFLIIPMWLNTYYLFEENELIVKSGFIKHAKIDCSSITSIAETRNPISSPAPSLDRLEICYKAKSGSFSDTIIISPKDKQGFIEQIKARNENVQTAYGKKPLTKANKIFLAIAGGISAIIIIGVGAMFVIGEREPVITIHDSSIQISAMYGTSIDIDNIANITLLDYSMRDIGAGARTNGYNGSAWRGHFRAGLLFVRPNSAPTIRIERNHGSSIFISFRDSERTNMLYSELTALGASN